MKIKKIRFNKRILSTLLALGISITPISALCEAHHMGNNIYMMSDGDIYYKRYDDKTNSYNNISIFDDENISSSQYGANQDVFRSNGNSLINNSLIVQEMNNYFPISDFESEKEALLFYEAYFKLIAKSGCGYAAATNFIFRMFEGKEVEFEGIFGFPMYTYNNLSMDIDFNYEILMLKFFNFYNLDKLNRKNMIIDSLAGDIYSIKTMIENEKREPVKSNHFISREELSVLLKTHGMKTYEYNTRNTNIDIIPHNTRINLGIPVDETFGYLNQFLSQYHLSLDIRRAYNTHNYQSNDIVVADNLTLEVVDNTGYVLQSKINVDLHYVYVIEVLKNGDVVVSSWGNKYVFNKNNTNDAIKLLIK